MFKTLKTQAILAVLWFPLFSLHAHAFGFSSPIVSQHGGETRRMDFGCGALDCKTAIEHDVMYSCQREGYRTGTVIKYEISGAPNTECFQRQMPYCMTFTPYDVLYTCDR